MSALSVPQAEACPRCGSDDTILLPGSVRPAYCVACRHRWDGKARAKPSKLHNQPVRIDGVYFPSRLEARRWHDLQLLARAGRIANLRRQVAYPLEHGGTYRADFVYDEDGRTVVEDAKGMVTDLYALKRRQFESQYGITIREVRA